MQTVAFGYSEGNVSVDELIRACEFYKAKTDFDEDYEYLDTAVIQAALSIADGEVFDGVIITDSYYYVVKLVEAFDEEATETEKNSIISDRETERFTELTEEWMEAASIETTDALSQIVVSDEEVYSIASE